MAEHRAGMPHSSGLATVLMLGTPRSRPYCPGNEISVGFGAEGKDRLGILRDREPVTVLPDYEERKSVVWDSGLNDLAIFRTEVVAPLLRYWGLAALARWSIDAGARRPA